MKNIGGVGYLSVVLLLLAGFSLAWGDIITVDDDGPADYDNIQAGIDDANDGDEVVIQPGIYTGDGNRDISFLGKAITVRSTDPNDPCVVAATVVDCNGSAADHHRGFYFNSSEDSKSVLDGLTIVNGYANSGGGIYCDNSLTIKNCTVENNHATGDGGGVSFDGTGYASAPHTPIISSCIIRNNTASYGGGIYCAPFCDLSVFDCVITGNAAGHGGGIYYFNYGFGQRGPAYISGCVISNNTASSDGGGILTAWKTGILILEDCIVSGNSAGSEGGGMWIDLYYTRIILDRCTFTGNSAPGHVGGIYAENPDGDEPLRLTITNCILWDNRDDEIDIYVLWWHYPFELVFIKHSDIAGGETWRQQYPASNCVEWGPGNIDVDPCFAVSGYWDDPCGTPGDANDDVWVDGDYHLKSQAGRWDANSQTWVIDANHSLCIDAGDPNDPNWACEIWPHGKRINMGAYGGTAEASMSLSNVGHKADLNGDGVVNGIDYSYFGDRWKIRGGPLREDFDRDGFVGFVDLRYLADWWLWGE